MEKRDLILDQIEKLGFFLQKLLGDFLNKNSLTSSIDKFENVRKELLNELNFDLDFLISQKNEDIKIMYYHLFLMKKILSHYPKLYFN